MSSEFCPIMANEKHMVLAIEKLPVYDAELRCSGLLEQEGWYMIRSMKGHIVIFINVRISADTFRQKYLLN